MRLLLLIVLLASPPPDAAAPAPPPAIHRPTGEAAPDPAGDPGPPVEAQPPADLRRAASLVREANRRLAGGEVAEALRRYEEAQVEAPSSPHVAYDLGRARALAGELEAAGEALERALGGALPTPAPGAETRSDASLAARAAFELGNVRARQGRLEEALDLYRRAIALDPTDRDARFNFEVVRRRLEELREKAEETPRSTEDQGKEEDQGKQEKSGEEQQGEEQGQEERQGAQQGQEDGAEQEAAQAGEETVTLSPEEAARLLDRLREDERARVEARRVRTHVVVEEDW